MRPPPSNAHEGQKAACSREAAAPSTSIRIREMMINGAATLGRHDSYPFEDFRKGTRVWIKDAERVWAEAELLAPISFQSPTISLRRLSDGESIDYDPQKSGLPFPCNPAVLLGKEDLTELSYLHEPAVLQNLRYRFERLEKIYTYCGIVLVAINPYADCAHFYGDDVIRVYQGQGKQVRGLVPHIFAIAEEAIFDLREYGKNQSIIVSGESGAGKTVSAKFVMRYLTHVAGGRDAHKGGGVESRVLASNPVMEAIGNARTIRNDNSSRFGKFIQIHFTDRFHISGAEMRTYLLEKSRVVYQSTNERNYHVFYQMTAARDEPLLADLDLAPASAFHYTNQGTAFDIPGVDDAEEFRRTVASLSTLLVGEEKQREIFRVLAGVLHLGNIGFVAHNDQAQVDPAAAKHVHSLCSKLFEVDPTALSLWLTAREIRAGAETVRKPLNVQEAVANRDALSKLLYACAFGWIVDAINGSLSVGDSKRRADAAARFVGVLDIYGFETFEVNSFEQFCINYANEKLQQSFNQHVFKLEQAEYEREDISWVRIEYYDNQACIDLIEARPGLIDYLDEQPDGGRTPAGWANCRTARS
ncbi:Myosin head and IQ calmodulin-binding region domain containing protein, protein [Aphelenchoides fujianensis]|nr:Myosin head and IQ calmodulin-binding region domain containing protein, protein [Aphelenchoides fujianensis]